MNDEQLQAIRARCEAATPGPWHEWHIDKAPSGIICDTRENGVAQTFNRIDEAYPNDGANASFIAHAREDVPTLLAEVADLRRQLVECQAELLWHKTNGVSGVKNGRG